MWSSTSNFPPVGLTDGKVTGVGAYRGCIDIEIPKGETVAEANFTHASYCQIAFRPILPARPRFHSIFKQLPEELIKQFNPDDLFYKLASKAQYSYYLYRKTAICVPFACSPGDIQLVSSLIGRRLALATGPVKCFAYAKALSNQQTKTRFEPFLKHEMDEIQFGNIENEPILVRIKPPPNVKQVVALCLIGGFFALVFLSTLWHSSELIINTLKNRKTNSDDDDFDENEPQEPVKMNQFGVQNKPSDGTFNNNLMINSTSNNINQVQISTPDPKRARPPPLVVQSSGLKYIAFYYFSSVTNTQEFLNTSMRSHEIKCLHGLRVITMCWIICVHTLQYNEWSGFNRVYSTEISFKNPTMQPLLNANYVVDNFFLMSGLLASYTTWFANKGSALNFSIFNSLLGRYLRLTPQALLVSLMYMLLPLIGDGPFWYDMTHDASKYCEKNWWINLLHLQAFYKDNEMCNLVGWWISVDMFFYAIAVLLLWWILNGKTKRALMISFAYIAYCAITWIYRHYNGRFTPNNLGNVPQIDEVWTEYVVKFSWSPYTHAHAFFLGFWLGYMLANNKWKHLVQRWSCLGWSLSILGMVLVSFSSHIWISGKVEPNNQIVSTTYNLICSQVWALSLGWIVVALHYGSLPKVSELLSSDMYVLLSKASFIVYLSHMLLIRIVFGQPYDTMEVSPGLIFFLMIGNVVISIIFGIFLCITFEGPCMKFQRWVLAQVKQVKILPVAGLSYARDNNVANSHKTISSNYSPTGVVLMK